MANYAGAILILEGSEFGDYAIYFGSGRTPKAMLFV